MRCFYGLLPDRCEDSQNTDEPTILRDKHNRFGAVRALESVDCDFFGNIDAELIQETVIAGANLLL